MAIIIKVYDYDTATLLEKRDTSAAAEIRYTGRNDLVNIEEDSDDGDAYLTVNDFGWWIGCQHAIRLVWHGGEEVILKPDSDIKIVRDKKRMAEILNGLMALPNLLTLMILSSELRALTNSYHPGASIYNRR